MEKLNLHSDMGVQATTIKSFMVVTGPERLKKCMQRCACEGAGLHEEQVQGDLITEEIREESEG